LLISHSNLYRYALATSIAAGVIYGTPLGLSLVAVSCAAGAGVSFVIARYAARPLIEKLFIKARPLNKLNPVVRPIA
jgi:uncharacterized membrane protein YdjX (TVP38/TMEM64 family)